MKQEYMISGILNLTPDSFSDGGKYKSPEDSIADAALMFEQGASWVDIGGESTRPGASPVKIDEEWGRIQSTAGPLICGYNGCISIDTRHPEIIRLASQFGTVIINDVTNFSDPGMIEIGAELGSICIVSHIPDSAKGNIQKAHHDKKVVSVQQVLDEQMYRVEEMISGGVDPSRIILDPGFGFGKTFEANMQLIGYAQLVDGFEVYLGISRKSCLKINPQTGEPWGNLEGLGVEQTNLWLDQRSAELALEAIKAGTKHIRVHNVLLHKTFIDSNLS